MCGLVGVAGQLVLRDVECFNDLLWIDAIRGRDGTGVAKVPYNDHTKIFMTKTSGDTARIFDMKSYHSIVNIDSCMLMGHNRYKTFGDSSWKNAHPFFCGSIVGAHNGTIRNKHVLKDNHKFDTDSEALFYAIAEEGLEETIRQVEGAWALTWYDKDDCTLNFLRNKERPLYYVLDDTHSTLFWASEASMLYMCLGRRDINFEGKAVKLLPEDVHFSFKIPDKARQPFEDPKRQKVKGREPGFFMKNSRGSDNGYSDVYPKNRIFTPSSNPVNVNDPGGATGAAGDGFKDRVGVYTKNILDNMTRTDGADVSLVSKGMLRLSRIIKPKNSKDAYYLGYDPSREVFDKKSFEDKMSSGCGWCNCNPVWGEPVKFLKDKTFLCCACATDPAVVESVRDLF